MPDGFARIPSAVPLFCGPEANPLGGPVLYFAIACDYIVDVVLALGGDEAIH